MMSPDDLNPNPPADDSHQSLGNSQKAACRPAAEAPRCPRCDSPNTKFCYYNNYSLSQPRYFCKTCRRYWTKGGALRNIPIGGGCRKNKKMSSKSCSRFSNDSMDSAGSSSYLDHLGGFKFSNIGLSSGMNFHTLDSNLPRTFSPIQHYQQLSTNSSFGNISRTLSSTSCFGLDNQSGNSSGSTFMGFNFPLSSSGLKQDHGNAQVLQDHDLDIKNNDVVASSIESLSSINQDLHWKLQQQRLGMMMFGEANNITNQNEVINTSVIIPPPMNIIPQKPQPILFENLEISSRVKDHDDVHQAVGSSGSGSATEWLLDHNSNHSLVNTTQTNSGNTGITGINQAWGNFYQYTPLP